MLNRYLHTALAARRVIQPHVYEVQIDPLDPAQPPLSFAGYDEAMDWWEQELSPLVSAVCRGAESDRDPDVWKLAHTLAPFCLASWAPDDQQAVLQAGLATVRHLDDQGTPALMSYDLGELFDALGQLDEAMVWYEQSLELSRASGVKWTEGFSLLGHGPVYLQRGLHEEAPIHLREARAVFISATERRGEGIAKNNIGVVYRHLGRPEDALIAHQEANDIFEETGSEASRAWVLRFIGAACLDLRRTNDAIGYYRQALETFRRLRDDREAARTLIDLTHAQQVDGGAAEARHSLAERTASRLASMAAWPARRKASWQLCWSGHHLPEHNTGSAANSAARQPRRPPPGPRGASYVGRLPGVRRPHRKKVAAMWTMSSRAIRGEMPSRRALACTAWSRPLVSATDS